jgi:hypothetical protein
VPKFCPYNCRLLSNDTMTETMTAIDNQDQLNQPDLLPSRQNLPRVAWFSICCKPQAESKEEENFQKDEGKLR